MHGVELVEGEDVVDLTCEGSEPAVVDLTNNDSVVIIESGRLMVSTKCGHLFCSQCIRDSLARAHNCPTCRKKLTYKQYHPIYI
ncbi:E3 ubiquitin-protein ligase RNF4 [Silurus meridionalis]|nr:E3 ubiquitin-protein ligase RNF4 [Silurus meridionalis]